MVAGIRAKIMDFGMSKLVCVNSHMTALILCPSNVLYMAPEALDEPPVYSNKLDVFSFGVLLVQILSRQFPNPTDRFQKIRDPHYPPIRISIPEIQRQSHLK